MDVDNNRQQLDKRGKIDQRRGPEHGPKAKNWGLGFSKSVRTSLGTVATPLVKGCA